MTRHCYSRHLYTQTLVNRLYIFVIHIGITVGVSCSHTNTRFTVTTDKKGDFISELPSKIESNCEAELQGSVKQLYASKNNVKSKIVKLGGDKYGLSSKLFFLKSCPRSFGSFSSSKTVDLPVPPEWGLAPTSYYVPFLPIIGIPWYAPF